MTDHPVPVSPGWAPASSCTPGCLPPAGGPRCGRLRVAVRMACLVIVLLVTALVTVLVAVLVAVAGSALPAGARHERCLRRCSRAALRAAGVRLRVTGGDRYRDGGGALVVANHLSWIDVLALDAVQPVRMLAKREVRGWPVIGGLAARSGALFVDRASLRALPATVAAAADALRAGGAVGVFPEGTTWCGGAAGAFRPAAFQAAIDAAAEASVVVRPVAIGFRLADGTPARGAAFVGEQTLLDSLLRVLRLPGLVCEVSLLPVIDPTGPDRRELAARAAAAVGTATGVAHVTAPPVRVRSRVPVGIEPVGVAA